MDLDQNEAVLSGFIAFVSTIKSSLKCTWIYAADNILRTKNNGGIRVNSFAADNKFCDVCFHFFKN